MRRLLLILMVFATPLAAQVRAPRKPANPPPAPRLKDGSPNLGPIEPNKGYWAPQHVTWDPNGEIQEYICQENNLWKDRVR